MPKTSHGTPCHIVIAEDNAADVMLVQQALKEHRIHCSVRVLRDGEQALRFLEQADTESPEWHMDLLVLDLHLPKHDGHEILRKLRSSRHYARTPVVVMTAMDANAPEMRAAAQSASVCFPKPSSLDDFLSLGAIVRGLLQHTGIEFPPMEPGGDTEAYCD